jgi:predicted HTH domain antitoxin
MKTLEISYPDTLSDSMSLGVGELEKELKMALAVKLFEMGRLTSGQAAQLASVSRYQFLHDLKNYGVNAVSWDAEEIAAELENA